MPYIPPILAGPDNTNKYSHSHTCSLLGWLGAHPILTNTFNILVLFPSISTQKHTVRCLKIAGNCSKSLQILKLRNKNSKLTQAAQLFEEEVTSG